MWGVRVVLIGGFSVISNVRVGKCFNILVFGMYVYVFVQVYCDEYIVFKKYVEMYKDCVFLVDMYDMFCLGMLNVIKVVKEFGDCINFIGICLDSGDLVYLLKKVWKMFDEVGFIDVKVIVLSDLDEYIIMNLKVQGVCIDVWGVGMKLIIVYDQLVFGVVYKFVVIEEDGKMVDMIKIFFNFEKVIILGRKKVYCIINQFNYYFEGDYIVFYDEQVNDQKWFRMFYLVYIFISKFVINFYVKDFYELIFEKGIFCY